jgi:hypothetical protein
MECNPVERCKQETVVPLMRPHEGAVNFNYRSLADDSD